jgi:hypothetical protein
VLHVHRQPFLYSSTIISWHSAKPRHPASIVLTSCSRLPQPMDVHAFCILCSHATGNSTHLLPRPFIQ